MGVKIKTENGYADADWTIENGVMVVSPKEVFKPKNGDVIVSGGDTRFVAIFKRMKEEYSFYYYALSILGGNKIPQIDNWACFMSVRSATEEEKKLLFDKLAEVGWEWDADKKELVKLKWKPKDGESYFYPSMYKCKILCCNDEWSNDVVDILIYNKGWVFKTEQECQEFCDRLNEAIKQVKP